MRAFIAVFQPLKMTNVCFMLMNDMLSDILVFAYSHIYIGERFIDIRRADDDTLHTDRWQISLFFSLSHTICSCFFT